MRETRITPRSASTCTSANTAPNECIEYFCFSSPGCTLAVTSMGRPWRATTAATGSRAPLRAIKKPSATVISLAASPCSGEPASAMAAAIKASRACAPAACTAGDTLATLCEPPDTGASGMRVSPRLKCTRSTGMPMASAATCVITV